MSKPTVSHANISDSPNSGVLLFDPGVGSTSQQTQHLQSSILLRRLARRPPRGIICLPSSLRFNDIGTQNPLEVWIAIGEKDRRPRIAHPPMRIVRFSKRALEFGQEPHEIE
jgi:hypothetical protein